MATTNVKSALIIGAGNGISGNFARRLADAGYRVGLASRSLERLSALQKTVKNSQVFAVDAGNIESIRKLFSDFDAVSGGRLDIVLFNLGAMGQFGPIGEVSAESVQQALQAQAVGAFTAAQEATKRMLTQDNTDRGRGSILFTGATASVKAFAESHTFAMGKFALRGLAQSLARELQPQGIHIVHFIIDGGVWSPGEGSSATAPTPAEHDRLDPAVVADAYFTAATQHRSAWTWEMELRPYVESF